MKPMIYFDFQETQDKIAVVINKARLKEILNEIYNAGVEDGRRENKSNSHVKGNKI